MITAVINQKGGVAKSTTVQSMGAGLQRKGYKVLLLDIDSQGNLSLSVGADKSRGIPSILEVLTNELPITDAIQTIRGTDIVPATISLAGIDMVLNEMGKEYRLKEAVAPIKDKYDFILIDTPPALGILTINALTCADNVVVPAEADVYSIEAVGQLSNTINAVKQYTNKDLSIVGILLTRYSGRAIISKALKDMIDTTAQCLNTKLFDAKIRECIAIKEAKAQKQDIFSYAGSSNAAIDYGAFVAEYLENIGK